jgi:transposase InsO family protein
LRQANRITCSLSSLYRVLRRCGALVRRPRKPKPVWIRYAKALPGERAQMDIKYLPEDRFQLTLVDDCSRYLAATVLERRTMAAVCGALPRLLQALPFSLRCIQTDNGGEFGQDFTRLLGRLEIRHTRIRPRTPHLNGKVERVQRTVQEEFWDGVLSGALTEWERQLQDYVRYYNHHRLHSAPNRGHMRAGPTQRRQMGAPHRPLADLRNHPRLHQRSPVGDGSCHHSRLQRRDQNFPLPHP